MKKITLTLSSILIAGGLQPTRTSAAGRRVTCDTCPIASVQPTASKPLAPADASHGCTMRTKRGFPAPDPNCTPGAANPTLTLQVLKDPSFRTGCIRNCVTAERDKAATYRLYGLPYPVNNHGENQTCELDHLVPLALGGADTLNNIWPECGPNHVALPQRYFKQKDMVESYLVDQAKTGRMALAEAQAAIATDWTQFLDAARDFCAKNPKNCR